MQTYTVEQAAAALAIDAESVRRWLRGGRIGGFKAGTAWRLTQADLDAFIERNRNSYRPLQADSNNDDDDADLVAAADATLDRLARGEETTISLEEWERRHGLGG